MPDNWKKIGAYAICPAAYPHENTDILKSDVKKLLKNCDKKILLARWTSDFDYGKETKFWYCIKDDELDISKLKAKRRYEITKGNRNFYTKVIEPGRYINQIYDCYLESLKGYDNVCPKSKNQFVNYWLWNNQFNLRVFAVFDRNNKLCGYSRVFIKGKYIPISSFKTVPSREKDGVNFALVYGIIKYFENDIKNGAYLCDGARNTLHETNFQDFLIKYFGFRKAYCTLHIVYRNWVGIAVKILFPFRKIMKFSFLKNVRALLIQEAWRLGKEK